MKQLAHFFRTHGRLLILLFLLSLPVLLPLIHAGFMQTDDGNWMVIRFSAFYQALRDGQFPVRWLGRLNSGYGYPVADFLYPGFLYLGVPLQVITSSVVTTVKTLFGLSLLASGIGIYLWLSGRVSRFGAFIGALVYLYSPYHLYDMTQRGSLGEVLALAVVPFVFWAMDRGYSTLLALLIGFLILSHNTLALMFIPVIVLYALIQGWRRKNMLTGFLGAFILGFGLSAFFWLPALYDLRYTIFHTTVISDWQQYFASLTVIGWGTLAVVLSALVLFLVKRSSLAKQSQLTIVLFLLVAVLSLFLSSPLSKAVWYALPVQFVQFPFRFLSLTVFAIAFLAAWTVEKKLFAGLVLAVLVIVTSLPFLTAQSYQYEELGFYTTNEATTTVKDEYMPIWAKQLPTAHAANLVATATVSLQNTTKTSHGFSFSVSVPKKMVVTINQLYFPGWEVLVDGKQTNIAPTNPQGLISFTIPQGQHHIRGQFHETPLRVVADVLSLLSSIVLGILFFLRQKNYAKK